jgi:hypothetical protein
MLSVYHCMGPGNTPEQSSEEIYLIISINLYLNIKFVQ